LHTIHTKEHPCRGISSKSCHHTSISDDTILKEPIGDADWQQFRTAEEVNETYSIPGEFATWTGDGYTLDIVPTVP